MERAWIKAATWAKHILATHGYLEKILGDHSINADFGLRSKVAQKLRELSAFHLHVCRNPRCKVLGDWAQ